MPTYMDEAFLGAIISAIILFIVNSYRKKRFKSGLEKNKDGFYEMSVGKAYIYMMILFTPLFILTIIGIPVLIIGFRRYKRTKVIFNESYLKIGSNELKWKDVNKASYEKKKGMIGNIIITSNNKEYHIPANFKGVRIFLDIMNVKGINDLCYDDLKFQKMDI